jgi:uncharacterized protein (TIGR03435 family)
MRGIVCGIFAAAILSAQAPVSFEVATIKPAPDIMTLARQIQSGKAHVGTKVDGHRVDIGFASLRDLICYAYDVQPHQVTGPESLTSQRWEVMATIPEGATKEQAPKMMQTLLAERFGLKFHRESKEHPVYALIVGKGGLKIKEAPPDEATPTPAPGDDKSGTTIETGQGPMNIRQDGKGNATINAGPMGNFKISMSPEGQMHMEMSKMSMTMLVGQLTPLLDHPVVDMTELKGNYQVALDIPMSALLNVARAQGINIPGLPPGAGGGGTGPADAASDPAAMDSVFRSMEKLGLKLDPRRQSFDDIVVDRFEKTPTEN